MEDTQIRNIQKSPIPTKKVDFEEREVDAYEEDALLLELENIDEEVVIYFEDFDDSENETEESDDEWLWLKTDLPNMTLLSFN